MLQDKIDCLQREFDRFKVNFQNELDNLKATNKSKIKLNDIYSLICNHRASGFEPQKIVIQQMWRTQYWTPIILKLRLLTYLVYPYK